jgi:hypothetical protein
MHQDAREEVGPLTVKSSLGHKSSGSIKSVSLQKYEILRSRKRNSAKRQGAFVSGSSKNENDDAMEADAVLCTAITKKFGRDVRNLNWDQETDMVCDFWESVGN